MNKPSLTVLFITLNEEFHIGAAIDNVKDIAEKIYVVDSGSADKTVEIAKANGAEVVYHKFENFGAQWNFALSLPIATDWTMKMDPDERLSEELKREIVDELTANRTEVFGYSLDRVLYFMGRRLNGMTNCITRIWRTGACKFTEVAVNEHPLVKGEIQHLRNLMEHYDSRDLHQWTLKQNHYSSLEAIRWYKGEENAATPRLFGTSLERRMWFKECFFAFPCRYMVLFLYYYFVKGLWKSGREGLAFIRLRIWNWRLREYKVMEMHNTGRIIGKQALN